MKTTGIVIDKSVSPAPKVWFCAYSDGGIKRSCYIASSKSDAVAYAKTLRTIFDNLRDVWVSFVWKSDFDTHGAKWSIGDLDFVDQENIKI